MFLRLCLGAAQGSGHVLLAGSCATNTHHGGTPCWEGWLDPGPVAAQGWLGDPRNDALAVSLPGLMGRAMPPERHSPHHLKEPHHLRGSITQGTARPLPPSRRFPVPRVPRGGGGQTPECRRNAGVSPGRGTGVQHTCTWRVHAQVAVGSTGVSRLFGNEKRKHRCPLLCGRRRWSTCCVLGTNPGAAGVLSCGTFLEKEMQLVGG